MFEMIMKCLQRDTRRNRVKSRRNWSINVYKTPSPLSCEFTPLSNYPVISGKDATDIDAAFVADPFLVKQNNIYYMFFEIFNNGTQRGEIAYATSANGIEWRYQKVILKEEFHLSYPYVFNHEGQFYMIPESSEDFSVRLYKATEFPTKWECVDSILRGYRFVDASVILHNGYWWLFVSTRDNDSLNLYFSEKPTGPWVMHEKSPVIKGNNSISRPGGRLLCLDGVLYRYAQDCHKYYGKDLSLIKITKLTTSEYIEELIKTAILQENERVSSNHLGVHHIDQFEWNSSDWLVVIDGFGKFGDSH